MRKSRGGAIYWFYERLRGLAAASVLSKKFKKNNPKTSYSQKI